MWTPRCGKQPPPSPPPGAWAPGRRTAACPWACRPSSAPSGCPCSSMRPDFWCAAGGVKQRRGANTYPPRPAPRCHSSDSAYLQNWTMVRSDTSLPECQVRPGPPPSRPSRDPGVRSRYRRTLTSMTRPPRTRAPSTEFLFDVGQVCALGRWGEGWAAGHALPPPRTRTLPRAAFLRSRMACSRSSPVRGGRGRCGLNAPRPVCPPAPPQTS